jgi:hypothetical protein
MVGPTGVGALKFLNVLDNLTDAGDRPNAASEATNLFLSKSDEPGLYGGDTVTGVRTTSTIEGLLCVTGVA